MCNIRYGITNELYKDLFNQYKTLNGQIVKGIKQEVKKPSKLYLILIGSLIGMIAMSIGVGGSIMLTPILVGFMHYNLKSATSLSLFFVMFSSIAGFISLSINDSLLFKEGIIVGVFSLLGVFIGIKLKSYIKMSSYKTLILSLYILILIAMVYKLSL